MADQRPVICHVLHRLYLAGAEVLAADLARKLRDRYRFVFACLDERGPLADHLARDGFEIEVLNRKPGIDLAVSRALRRLVRKHNVRLLHAHQYSPFFYAANARGFAGRPPILFTEHGRHYPDSRRFKRVLANKFMLRRNDRVTAVGQFIKDALVDNEGIPSRRIEVIYNGIDPARFGRGRHNGKSEALRQEVRRELGLIDDQPVVLQVARFHPVKDHLTAVGAMRYVAGVLPQAVLLLAGDGIERRRISGKARTLGVKDQIRMLGVRDDVPRLMAAADVFVLSSLSEGISVTLLEAMASSLPICATDVGGNAEVVADGKTGLLSPRADSKRLGRNMVSLLQNAPLRQKMGRAGRLRLLEKFAQDRMHASYAGLYDRMIWPGSE